MTDQTSTVSPFAFETFPGLSGRGVRHAFTFRTVGSSAPPFALGNLGLGVPDDRAAVLANRRQAAAALGLEITDLVFGYQVHGVTVATVDDEHRGRGALQRDGLPATDAMITSVPRIGLGILIADCSALVLFDPDAPALGVAHLGWRGTVARLAERLVRAMGNQFGSRPDRLIGGIAPGIGPCCYEVGPEVIDAVRRAFAEPSSLFQPLRGGLAFDIPGAILQQLADAGVDWSQIERTSYCTSCRTDLFFSHRAEHGRTGRQALFAALPAH
jgi:YfiH family protein